MKKHSAAIRKIKQTIRELSGKRAEVRSEILALKFDQQGRRRPETGQDRYWLKENYCWGERRLIRANLLAYGFLRDVPYKVMEPISVQGQREPGMVLKALHAAIGDDESLKAEWTMDRVYKLFDEPAVASEAAE